MNYDELITSFKQLNNDEKEQAIIEFITNNIRAIATINKNVGNSRDFPNIKFENDNPLDNIYELLHVFNEETSSFAEFVEKKFYE